MDCTCRRAECHGLPSISARVVPLQMWEWRKMLWTSLNVIKLSKINHCMWGRFWKNVTCSCRLDPPLGRWGWNRGARTVIWASLSLHCHGRSIWAWFDCFTHTFSHLCWGERRGETYLKRAEAKLGNHADWLVTGIPMKGLCKCDVGNRCENQLADGVRPNSVKRLGGRCLNS